MEHPPPGAPSPLPCAIRAWYLMLSYGASIWVTSRAAVAKRVVPSDTCQAGTKSTRQGGGAGPEVYATNCTVNRTTRLRPPSPIRDSGAILPGRMDIPKNVIAETCVVGGIVALAVARPRPTATCDGGTNRTLGGVPQFRSCSRSPASASDRRERIDQRN